MKEMNCICLALAWSILDALDLVMMIPRRKRISEEEHRHSLLEHTMPQEQTPVHKRIDMNYDLLKKNPTTFPAPAEQSLPRPSASPAYSSSHP